ncbi:DMT family transporter [Nocardioides sp. DS6]|uniref:DMT family transporter n=1 Tax=Nocardioides eburneus TaxID=3231482 RepID=A0ABV3SWZ2_9ACTN
MRDRTSILASFALLALAACWGSTFFMIRDLLDRVPTLDFLAVRFTIAGVALLAVAPGAVRRLSPLALRRSVLLGLLYGVAQILQTAGLAHTPATVSGFITGTYVVLTPLLAAPLLRVRIGKVTWLAVVIALVGLGVLTLRGVSVGIGETMTLGSAVLYALHIVGLGAWSRHDEALGSSIVQLLTIAVVCLLGTAPDGLVLPHRAGDWVAVLYMAIIVGALGLLCQTWAQAHLAPTPAAIAMSMEPVFAALFAVWFGGEPASLRLVLGGLLVLSAMLLVELVPRRKVEAEVLHPSV